MPGATERKKKSVSLLEYMAISFFGLLLCCCLLMLLLNHFYPQFPTIDDPDQFVQDCCNWMETFRPKGPHQVYPLYLKAFVSTDPEVPQSIKSFKRKGRIEIYEGYLRINLEPGVGMVAAYVVICSDLDSFQWEHCAFSLDHLKETNHPQIFRIY